MPKLYISEYAGYPFATDQVTVEPCLTDQTPVTIGASSTKSVAFGPSTRVVRIHTDAICSVSFGANPTATANNKRLAANATEYFAVQPGHVVAVIQNT